MPQADTEAMQAHLDAIGRAIAPGSHALVIQSRMRIASARMLLKKFPPMIGAAPPNRVGGAHGGNDQHGRTARFCHEGWLAVEPQMTAIAIVGRLADLHPDQFDKKQHSIVQRLLRALRKSAAQRLIAETTADKYENVAQPPGAVDGSGYAGPDPPTAPLPVPALNVDPSANVLRPPAW